MIADVDETLRQMLLAELAQRNPRWKTTPPRITLVPPALAEQENGAEGGSASSGDAAAAPRVNLFLHDIRENVALREETFERVRPGVQNAVDGTGDNKTMIGLRRPPVRLNLSYLVTAHAGGKNNGDVASEHTLLSDVLAVLLRMGQVPTRYFSGDLDTSVPLPLLVAQPDDAGLQNPAALWSALGGRLRPTIGLVVLASFNPFDTKWTKIVREAVLGMGQGTPASHKGDGQMPQRPLDLRSQRVCVAGVVTDADGRAPLAGVRVSAHAAEGAESAEGDAVPSRDAALTPLAATDERGFFFFLNLAPGPWRLRLQKRGFIQSEHLVKVPPLGRPDLVESLVIPLVMQTDGEAAKASADDLASVLNHDAAEAGPPILLHQSEAARRVAVSGVLRYPDGRAASYLPVRAEITVKGGAARGGGGAQKRTRHTTTDHEGFYCFFDLPEAPGAFVLFADIPGTGEVPLQTNGANVSSQSSGAEVPKADVPAGRKPKGERVHTATEDDSQTPASLPAADGAAAIVPLPGSVLPT